MPVSRYAVLVPVKPPAIGKSRLLGVADGAAAVRVPEDGGVEAFLAAEVVVDGGDVGVGLGADVADGGGLETLLGEDGARGLDQARPRRLAQLVLLLLLGHVSNTRLKQMFEMSSGPG